jgi:hypothetical protein
MNFEKVNYAGWPNCLRLSNSEMELVATTDIGPRIIRLGFIGGKNLFKEFPDVGKTGGENWKNYGGHRLWHAPEIRPRTYAPDNSSIEHNWDGATLKLIQPVEATTGIQKEIEVTLDAQRNAVKVLHRLRNKNLWDIELSPWALTVMQGPGRAIFPQEPPVNQLLPVRPLVLWGYTDMADKRWTWGAKYIQLASDPAATTPQKVGLGNTLGWAAYYTNGQLFLKRYPFDVKAIYPDFGCNTESYTRGDMLEVETLGSLAKLAPGATVEHTEEWFLFKTELGETEAALDTTLLPLLAETDKRQR